LDFDESNTVLDDMNNGRTESEESKALVPTYLDQYKRLLDEQMTSFSFSNNAAREESSVVKAVLAGDDPYMAILLPASVINGDTGFSTLSDDENQPWIELGCQVVSARVVDGVNFVGDPSATPAHGESDGSS